MEQCSHGLLRCTRERGCGMVCSITHSAASSSPSPCPCCPALVPPSPTHGDPASTVPSQPHALAGPRVMGFPGRPGLAAEQGAEGSELRRQRDEEKLGQQGLAVRPWRDEQRLSLRGCSLTPAFSGEGGRRHLSGGSAVPQHELRAWLSSSAVWRWQVPTTPGLIGARAMVQAPLG